MPAMSMKSLTQELADRVEEGKDRISLNKQMDDMWHNKWTLPEGLPWWVKKVVSSDPADALATGARTLSTVMPKPQMVPPDSKPETQRRVNEIEMALKWQYSLASKRINVTRQVVESALRYDDIEVQVIDLAFQNALDKKSDDEKKPWNTGGQFVIRPHNPSTVYPVHTDNALESVLLVKNMRYESILRQWGNEETAKLRAWKDEKGNKDLKWLTYYDLTDRSYRYVIAMPTIDATTISQPADGKAIVIFKGKHGLPFINWVSEYGGSGLDTEEVYQRHPLLVSVAQTNQWNIQNLLESIVNSQVIELAASAKSKSKTYSGSSPEIDHDVVGGNVELQVGEDYEPTEPPQLDPNLKEMIDRISARINKSTVARFLQNLDLPPGAAYATVNAVMQSAINALDPYKQLSERAIASIYVQMLQWSSYNKRPLQGQYTVSRYNKNFGKRISIDYKLFDPENLNVTCELTATVPTDMMQRVNAGVMMYRDLRYPLQRVYEDLGVNDPEAAERMWVVEKLFETYFANYMSSIAFEEKRKETNIMNADAIKLQTAQQDMMNAKMAAQEAAAGGGQGAEPPPAPAPEQFAQMNQRQSVQRATTGLPENERLAQLNAIFQATQGGQGFNPNMQGSSPAQVFPGGTRETMTGMTQGGEEEV